MGNFLVDFKNRQHEVANTLIADVETVIADFKKGGSDSVSPTGLAFTLERFVERANYELAVARQNSLDAQRRENELYDKLAKRYLDHCAENESEMEEYYEDYAQAHTSRVTEPATKRIHALIDRLGLSQGAFWLRYSQDCVY